MKQIFAFFLMSLAVLAFASEAIIDPDLMNKDTWSEPVFGSATDVPREVASNAKPEQVEIAPTQYLEVRKEIPQSEPTLSRSWVEHKILNEKE